MNFHVSLQRVGISDLFDGLHLPSLTAEVLVPRLDPPYPQRSAAKLLGPELGQTQRTAKRFGRSDRVCSMFGERNYVFLATRCEFMHGGCQEDTLFPSCWLSGSSSQDLPALQFVVPFGDSVPQI